MRTCVKPSASSALRTLCTSCGFTPVGVNVDSCGQMDLSTSVELVSMRTPYKRFPSARATLSDVADAIVVEIDQRDDVDVLRHVLARTFALREPCRRHMRRSTNAVRSPSRDFPTIRRLRRSIRRALRKCTQRNRRRSAFDGDRSAREKTGRPSRSLRRRSRARWSRCACGARERRDRAFRDARRANSRPRSSSPFRTVRSHRRRRARTRSAWSQPSVHLPPPSRPLHSRRIASASSMPPRI